MPRATMGDYVLMPFVVHVVTKYIPSNVVGGGNLARIICTLDEYFVKSEQYNINSKNINSHRKKTSFENQMNVKL